MDKNLKWRKERAGIITASPSKPLFVVGKKVKTDAGDFFEYFGEGTKTYLTKKRAERRKGRPEREVSFRAGTWGNEQEVYGFEWLRENGDNLFLHADRDYEEKLFFKKKVEFNGFSGVIGDSIDGFEVDKFTGENLFAVEQKTPEPWSKNWMYLFCEDRTEAEFKTWALKEYRYQIACHLISHDIPLKFFIYEGQDPDDEFDTLPITDPSRGHIVIFKHDDLDLDFYRDRLAKAAHYLDLDDPIEDINKYFGLTTK